jgi:hypothetical protein
VREQANANHSPVRLMAQLVIFVCAMLSECTTLMLGIEYSPKTPLVKPMASSSRLRRNATELT